MFEDGWPPWNPSRPIDLVRYVSVKAVVSASLQPQERLFRADPQEAVEVAAAAYDLLHARQIPYAHEPWSPTGGQLIRSPQEMVVTAGTCVDLAVAFAAIAWQAQLRPLLVLSERHGTRHAFVLIDLASVRGGGFVEHTAPLIPVSPDDPALEGGPSAGLYRLNRQGSKLDRFLPIDAACSAVHDGAQADFEEAVESGRRWIASGDHLLLIDVLQVRRAHAVEEFDDPDPQFWPPIHSRLVAPAGEYEEYSSRAELERRLEQATGRVVLFGASGLGKSMLAYRAALAAKHGHGWFLAANDAGTLRSALAQAELAERPGQRDAFNRDVFADLALSRLRATLAPWVVVLDNADCDPADVERLLPEPGPGQTLIVTTANRQWIAGDQHGQVEWAAGEQVAVEHLGPLLPGESQGGFPDWLEDLIGGSPLLARTMRDALEAGARPPGGPTDEAPSDLVWRTALSAMDAPAQDAAEVLAWAPGGGLAPDDFVHLGFGQRQVEEIIEVGVAARDGVGRVHMHRMLRRAGRVAPGTGAAPVIAMLGEPDLKGRLFLEADEALLDQMERELAAAPASVDVAEAWVGLGGIWEYRGRSRNAASLFDRALEVGGHHLGPCLRADCLQGKARAVFADDDATEQAVDEATGWLSEIRSGLDPQDDEQQLRRVRAAALDALFRRDQVAARIDQDPGSARLALESIRSDMQQSMQERTMLLDRLGRTGAGDDVDRALFNIASIDQLIATCLTGYAARAAHDVARERYRSVRDARIERYGDLPVGQVAACVAAEAMIDYNDALSILAGYPAGQALAPKRGHEMAELLRAATAIGYRALVDWQSIEGATDGPITTQSLDLLIKVLLLRRALAETPQDPASDEAAAAARACVEAFTADLTRQQARRL